MGLNMDDMKKKLEGSNMDDKATQMLQEKMKQRNQNQDETNDNQ